MKNKLELKHYSPYQEHKVKLYDRLGNKYNIAYLSTKKIAFIDVNGYGEVQKLSWQSKSEKPLMALRPYSDLIKDGKLNPEFNTITCTHFDPNFNNDLYASVKSFIDYDNHFELCFPYEFWNDLFKHHFDVFGLIKEKLAIDINTLK